MPTNNVQLKRGTAAAFANLATKDSNTIYFITDTNRLFVGNSEYSRPVLYGAGAPSEAMPQGTLYIREVTENSITRQQLYYSNGSTWTAVNIEPGSILTEAIVVGNDGNVTPTAVTTTFKVPTITVDTKGRVSSAVERTIDLVNFMPKKGGTFTGDVVVDADLTADSIKTDGTIEITSNNTERVDILGIEQTTNTTTVLFENNLGTAATPIKIEAKYHKENSDGDSSYLGIRANQISLGGKVVDIRGNVAIWGSTSTYGPITINAGDYAGTAATQRYVDNAIASALSASDAMVLKGTLGTNGTVTTFNNIDLATAVKGDTYKVITSDVLPTANSSDSTDHILTPGDLIVYMGEDKFIYVPSGDEDVTSVKIAGSGDTINVSTAAQTGNLVLGTAAGVNTTSTVTDDSTTVPTTAAVKTYVDNAESLAMPKTGGTFTGGVTMNADFTAQDEITIASTDTQENLVNGQQHSDTKLIFGNANPVSGDAPMSIEGCYRAGVYGAHVYDMSRIKINAGSFEACGLIVKTGSDYTVSLMPQHDIPNREQNVETESIVMQYNVAQFEGEHDYTSISLNASNIIAQGHITLPHAAPTQENHAVNKAYVDTALSNMTDTKVTTVTTTGDGNVVTSGSISDDGATLTLTKGESFIPTSGGTFTGAVTLAGAPTTDLNAATKKYVDDSVSAATLTWGTL